jgi:hypothetical protein
MILALAATAVSSALLLWLCLGDPKRRRALRIDGAGQGIAARRAIAAAACLPGIACAVTGDTAAFLVWLGGCGAAGWLIALMVWLIPSAGQSRLLLILIITYLVAIMHASHLIAGSVEVAYLVVTGQLGFGGYLGHFFVPTFIGNVVGGTSLVALLNHAPVREELDQAKKGG